MLSEASSGASAEYRPSAELSGLDMHHPGFDGDDVSRN
jgi:hypothetical protein